MFYHFLSADLKNKLQTVVAMRFVHIKLKKLRDIKKTLFGALKVLNRFSFLGIGGTAIVLRLIKYFY